MVKPQLPISELSRMVVMSVDDIDPAKPDASKYVYVVPKEDGYDEYVLIDGRPEYVGELMTEDLPISDAPEEDIHEDTQKELAEGDDTPRPHHFN